MKELRQQVIELYVSKYWDCNYRFFSELLAKHENINISESTLRKILIEEYLLSPKCQRKKKNNQKRIRNKKRKC